MSEVTSQRMAFDHIFTELSKRHKLGVVIGGLVGAYAEVPIQGLLRIEAEPCSLTFATIYPIKRLGIQALVDHIWAVGETEVLVESGLSSLSNDVLRQLPEEQLKQATEVTKLRTVGNATGVLDRLLDQLDAFRPSF